MYFLYVFKVPKTCNIAPITLLLNITNMKKTVYLVRVEGFNSNAFFTDARRFNRLVELVTNCGSVVRVISISRSPHLVSDYDLALYTQTFNFFNSK